MPEKLSQGPRVGQDLSRTGSGLHRGPFRGKTLNAAPWSGTWPAPGATLDLDFANNRGFVRGVGQGGAMDAVTFTRASVGRFVNEQGLLDEAAINQPRFDWASTAQIPRNLLQFTEQFNNAYWGATNGAVTANTAATTDPLGGNTADLYLPAVSGNFRAVQRGVSVASLAIKTISVYAKAAGISWLSIRDNTTAWAFFDLTNGVLGTVTSGYAASITDVGNGWYRCVATNTNGVVTFPTFMLSDSNGISFVTVSGTEGIYLWGAQGETGTTATDYQAISQPTTNTPLTANPTSNGLLIEESRTNRILWNRDATQANWVSTNITAAKDQTGIDGVANAASSLTATSADGTCIQTITLASGSRTGSVYLKRLTGTGTVQVSLDGSTYSTVDLSDTEWRRIVLSGTVTNPTVGIKIATSGDAVAMDYAQVEDGAFATTPILTTTATVARSADVATFSRPYFFNNFKSAYYFESSTGIRGTAWRYSGSNTYLQTNGFAVQVGATNGALGTSFKHLGLRNGTGAYESRNLISSLNGNYSRSVDNSNPELLDVSNLSIQLGSHAGSNFANGHITRFAYFPMYFTREQMIEMTKL